MDNAESNPFRYRSYYYDSETNLYYLNSRYYDPELGRFINADDISNLSANELNGLNLYAYCCNNPVNYIDSNGDKPKWWNWLLFGIGALFVVAAAAILSVATFGVGVAAFGATLAGSVTLNMSMGILIGAGIGSVIGISSGAIYSMVTGADLGESILSGFLMGFGGGAIIGAAVGAAIGAVTFTPNPMIGHTVKLGQIAANQGGKITSWGLHGAQRMAERNISKFMAKLTVKFGISIIQNSGKVAYLTQKTFIVLNSAGKVITAYGLSYFDKGVLEIIKLLFRG